MWVQPEITQKLYVALWAAFLASCFFPYRLVGLAVGKEKKKLPPSWEMVRGNVTQDGGEGPALCLHGHVPALSSGLYAGIKFFLIDFIFKRCPRLRAKYDTPYIIWRSLPTDPQLKERAGATVSRRVSRPSQPPPPCGGCKQNREADDRP